MSQQKTYGMPLKRARSVQEGSLVSASDLQLFRPRSTSGNGRAKFERLISLPSASPTAGSNSQSPPPTSPFVNKQRNTSPLKRSVSTYGAASSLTHSPVLKRSSSLGSPPPSAEKAKPIAAASSNRIIIKSRQAQSDDPFADPFADDTPAVATQPIDDETDDGPPQPAASPLTYGRSASVAAVSAAASSSSWSGSSTEKADEIRFTIDGLHSSNSSTIRASSAHKLLELLLSDTKNGLSILRAGNGFASMTEAMPPPSQLYSSDNQILVTLFVAVSFIASFDVTNANFFNAKGIDILYATAFPDALKLIPGGTGDPLSQASEDMDDELKHETNSISTNKNDITKADVASAFGGIRKSKKRVSKSSTSPSQLLELLQQQQRESMQILSKTDSVPINELHLESVVRLEYLALLTLTAFSEEAQFVQYFIASSKLGSSRAHLQLILEQLKQSHESLMSIHVKEQLQKIKTKGKKAPAVAVTHSAEFFLEQHRLQCLLTMLENITHHHSSYFEQICTISLNDRTLGDEMEEGEEEAEVEDFSSNKLKPSEAVQLFFRIIEFFTPNIAAHQSSKNSESSPDAAHSNLLPTSTQNSILPLFHILRLLVNVTNRNEVGVNVINAEYQAGSSDEVCGLQLLLNLIACIQWSYFSEISGQPDMFNLMSVSLPIIVNSVEVSQVSRKLLDEQCSQSLTRVITGSLPQLIGHRSDSSILLRVTCCVLLAVETQDDNLKLGQEAGFPLPTARGSLPALDFVCMLWKFLHQQLERITQEYVEKEKARDEERKRSGAGETKEAELEMTLEQQISDPFAAAARRAAANVDAASIKKTNKEAPASALEAHLVAQIEQADAEEEEVSLGFRTLASMSSLLLGFFACSSVNYRRRILRSLGMANFAPMLRYIQEFLFLQSDSQLLQQEGLETSFRMLETLKTADKRSESVNGEIEDDSLDDSSSSFQPVLKKQKLETLKSASPSASNVSNPSSSPTVSTFDALFQRQAKMRK